MGSDLPSEPMPLHIEDKRYLEFGQIVQDYYSDRRFDAMARLLVHQKTGLYDDSTEYAELILGDLYVNYGLPDQADEIFNRLLSKDILPQTRAETWFHKAMQQYRRGRLDKAAEVLASDKVDALPDHLKNKRFLSLANIYISQGKFKEAQTVLQSIPDGSLEGAYAKYNMGVSMIRADQVDSGIAMLNGVSLLPPASEELNALKDRSALAIGLTELKRENLDQSRSALTRIRADGPFSNEALLTLGLANYRRDQFRKALPLWLELVRRNPSHGSVQEALMLAPRAYEELNALPQALAGYQFAAKTFRNELKQIERAIRSIDQADWLSQLEAKQGVSSNNTDPMAQQLSYKAAGGEEMAYLYKLFASHEFNERFRLYRELLRIRQLLLNWRNDIPALEQTFANQQIKLQSVLPTAQANLVTISKSARKLSEQAAEVSANIPLNLNMKNPADLASQDQLFQWELIQALEAASKERNASKAMQERIRRVKGVLLYDIAHNAQPNREEQLRLANDLQQQAEIMMEREAAVAKLVKEATLHIRGDLGSRLASKRVLLDNYIESTETLIENLGQMLKNNALKVLASQRRQLGDQLGEAHLSIARLQDVSILEEISKGERPNAN